MNLKNNLEIYIVKIINKSSNLIDKLKNKKNKFSKDNATFFIDIKKDKLMFDTIDEHNIKEYLMIDENYLMNVFYPLLNASDVNSQKFLNIKDYKKYILKMNTKIILNDLTTVFINQYRDIFQKTVDEQSRNENSFFKINFSDLARLNIPVEFIRQYLGEIKIYLDLKGHSFSNIMNYSFISHINIKTFPEILSLPITDTNCDLLFDYLLKRKKMFENLFPQQKIMKHGRKKFDIFLKNFVLLNYKILNAFKIQKNVPISFENQVSSDREIIKKMFSLENFSTELIGDFLSSEFMTLKITNKKDAIWFLKDIYFWQHIPKHKDIFIAIGNSTYHLYQSGFLFENNYMKKI